MITPYGISIISLASLYYLLLINRNSAVVGAEIETIDFVSSDEHQQQRQENNDNNNSIKNCTYLLLAPFSPKDDKKSPVANYTELAASYIASAQIAMDDLNTREECRGVVNFVPTLLTRDTKNEDTVGFRELVNAETSYRDNLCGVVGPMDLKGQERSILYTETVDLPQFFVGGGDIDDLAGKDGETAIGNFLGIESYFDLLAEYLSEELNITHMAFIGTDSKKMRLSYDVFAEAFERRNITAEAFRFEDEKHESRKRGTINPDLERIQKSGYRNVFLSPDERKPEALAWMAEDLEFLGMLDNGDYQYFLFEDSIRPHEIDFLFGNYLKDTNHPFAKFIHGTGWFSAIDPYELTGDDDPFVQKWRNFDPSRQIIKYPKDGIPVTSEYYQTAKLPVRHSSFVYDSVLSLGLGECAAQRENDNKNNNKNGESNDKVNNENSNKDKDDNKNDDVSNIDTILWHNRDLKEEGEKKKKKKPKKPIKNNVVRNIINMKPYRSASGLVKYTHHNKMRYRSVDTMIMAMFNFRVNKSNNKENNVVVVKTPIVAYYDHTIENNNDNNNNSKWKTLDGFIFSSSNNNNNNDRPQFVVGEENFLSNWVFGLGITLLVIGCIFAFVSFVVVTVCEKDKAMKMAQPIFLKLICLGSFIEVFSIFTLSFDEGHGWNDASLDNACMATPWLFFIGHAIIYSALFCKLWRVDQVMSTKKRAVSPLQVLWPLGIVLIAIVSILTVWTVVSPWSWERKFVTHYPPETYGKCYSPNFIAFSFTLALILMICTILTGFIVWKTRDISQDLSDTSTVIYLIITQLQAWFVGLPILAAIGDASVDSVYLGRILLIWVFAMAPLLIVLLPRITTTMRARMHPEVNKRKNRGSIHISGLAASTISAATAHQRNSTTTASITYGDNDQKQPLTMKSHRNSATGVIPSSVTEDPSVASSVFQNEYTIEQSKEITTIPENVSFRSSNV